MKLNTVRNFVKHNKRSECAFPFQTVSLIPIILSPQFRNQQSGAQKEHFTHLKTEILSIHPPVGVSLESLFWKSSFQFFSSIQLVIVVIAADEFYLKQEKVILLELALKPTSVLA